VPIASTAELVTTETAAAALFARTGNVHGQKTAIRCFRMSALIAASALPAVLIVTKPTHAPSANAIVHQLGFQYGAVCRKSDLERSFP